MCSLFILLLSSILETQCNLLCTMLIYIVSCAFPVHRCQSCRIFCLLLDLVSEVKVTAFETVDLASPEWTQSINQSINQYSIVHCSYCYQLTFNER